MPEIPLEQAYSYLFAWGSSVFRVILTLVLGKIAVKAGYSFINKFFEKKQAEKFLDQGRGQTFASLFCNLWRYLIFAIVLLMVLGEFNVELAPLIAGLGIVGLALGFGAQGLVKDIISGLFIIAENQFSVGDYVTAGGYSGIVQDMGLRITKLKDFSGELHIIPNRNIETVTNQVREPRRALVEVSIAYEENINRALQVLHALCKELAQTYDEIVEGPDVLGVSDLGDSDVVIIVMAKTTPMSQWKIEREIRKAIKNKLDEEGIEIPYPRRVIYKKSENEESA